MINEATGRPIGRCSGKYFRRWMRKLNLNYKQVADVLMVDEKTVRTWEKSKSVKRIVKLAFDHAFRCKKPGARFKWGQNLKEGYEAQNRIPAKR